MDESLMNLDKRLKAELVEYANEEMENGYSIDAIKRVLMSFEKDQNIIDSAIEEVLSKKHKPGKKKPGSKKITEDIFYEIVYLLKGYIEEQKKRGYKIDHIREALMNYGHIEKVVEAATGVVENGTQPVYEGARSMIDINLLKELIFPFSLISFAIILLSFSMFTEASILRITVLFFPVILSIISVKIFFRSARNKQILIMFPLFFTAVFFILGFAKLSYFDTAQLEDLTALNFLFSIIYFYLLYVVHQKWMKHEYQKPGTPLLHEKIHADVKEEMKSDEMHPHFYTPKERLKHIELTVDKDKKQDQ